MTALLLTACVGMITGAFLIFRISPMDFTLGAVSYTHLLERLSFIRPGLRILLIGAGGASRGVLLPLLSLDCAVTITNRTVSRACLLYTSW